MSTRYRQSVPASLPVVLSLRERLFVRALPSTALRLLLASFVLGCATDGMVEESALDEGDEALLEEEQVQAASDGPLAEAIREIEESQSPAEPGLARPAVPPGCHLHGPLNVGCCTGNRQRRITYLVCGTTWQPYSIVCTGSCPQ